MKGLKQVLDLQNAMAKKSDFIHAIEAQIDQQKEDLARRQGLKQDLAALHEQYEDLAAKVVLGEADSAQLKKLQKEINAAKDAEEAGKEESAIIGGLERRLDEEKKALERIEAEHRSSIEKFLRTEAEEIGTEYIEAAERVEELFVKLSRIGRVHQRYLSPGQDAIINSNANSLFSLPTFRLAAHQGKADNIYNPVTKGTSLIKKPRSINEEIKPEIERLAGLGIAL